METLRNESLREKLVKELENNFDMAMKDKDFANIVSKLKISKKDLIKFTSKLEKTAQECKNCRGCKGLFECQNEYNGHISMPKIIDERIYFTYKPCKYEELVINKETSENILSKVTMKDIDTNDKKQLKIIKWMDDFYESFDIAKNNKGLYLHGSFGSGKTYLLTALLNELRNNKNVNVSIVYLADTLRDLKDDFENFSFKMQRLMDVDILLLDDIGAEKETEWSRDEVLGPLLQYRMNNNKTTFFTSNLTISELEINLALASNSVDKVKARRIIERIKYLTTDMELLSESRRK